MPFKTKVFKCISLVLFVLVFINTSQAQKIKIDGVGVVVGKNIVLDSDIEKFKLELENSSEGKIKITDCENVRAADAPEATGAPRSSGQHHRF